ncbi:dihydrolipoamide acetyltransferase family protein [Cryobacterium psychrophilum]|uniref:Dihydrolipoamide acetyltransferase component of pyruvate dehydrogenase complex n=1 Tax=Cryobacterium psychrophilum TaxID=41988 RepID=A0A4Y8KMZ0_9MICO|nr:dihydrolipoamide acetyltransferase family protein [Cryobacterium psychrophilum]TDW31546.1 pyruvate dehydrogenase E2 component (dihydrolipoamide acetyltransferase) [Cryobacterium psychrophilum]TFD79302.1 2-oxo acid dehydrogenase subunit E2 [Cryobacterium psychrophilum]
MGEFRMPSLGADMERGKLIEWLIKPGDYVHRGDVIAAVDTDKTVMDVESFEEGVVSELLVEVGTTVPVGTALAHIVQTPATAAGPSKAGPGQAEPLAPLPPEAPAAAPASAELSPREEPPGFVSPPVRHLAHELGVDTTQLHGTGRNGALTRADVEHASVTPSRQPPPTTPAPAAPHRVRSSPRARRLAAELGVDPADITGTGPQGAVTEADVRRAAELRTSPEPAAPVAGPTPAEAPASAPPAARPPKAVPAAAAAERAASLRRAIGTLMSRSKKTIPHYYLSTTIDLRAALVWMETVNAGRQVAERLVPAALLLKASARAARDVPEMNGFYTDGAFQPNTAVHLGVAVALRQGGMIAPAIHDADTLTVDQLMERLRDLVGRARAGRLQRAEMADSTITVTNLGELGVESVFGVIYPPQVALAGFGRIVEQPWAHNGMLGVRQAVTATLSADHRVSDGLRGGRFLARIDELLQIPEEL